MSAKTQQILSEVALANGLQFDAACEVIFGNFQGYSVSVNNNNNLYSIYLSVNHFGNPLEKKELAGLAKQSKVIKSCIANGYAVTMTVNLGTKKEKMINNLREALGITTSYLAQNGYTNCCQFCGADQNVEGYICNGMLANCCENCFREVSQNTQMLQQQEANKSENVVAGIVGAFLGSLLGVLVIVILGQLGYVAAISGVVVAICTLKGYEMLAGKLSKKGVIISIIIMIIAVFLGNKIDWAVTIASYFEVDFFTAYNAISEMLSEGYIEGSTYYGNLALVYLFAIGGAATMIPKLLAQKKSKFYTKKLGMQ